MAKKLYVGNLSYTATEDDLRTMFAEAGTVVSATIITDRETRRSKGFGFVEMETEEAARDAIAKLNGREVGGRTITVSEARPPREREFSGGGGRGGYGGGGGGGYGGGGGGRSDRRKGPGNKRGGGSRGGYRDDY